MFLSSSAADVLGTLRFLVLIRPKKQLKNVYRTGIDRGVWHEV